MLYSWLTQRLALYLGALHQHLPAVMEGANLASVLEHCMYCASSLARVGLDFGGLLLPVFEVCTLRMFGGHLGLAVEAFMRRLDSHKWVPMPGPLYGGAKGKAAAAGGTAAGGGDGGDGSTEASSGGAGKDGGAAAEDLAPPYALMEHLPLAVLTNGLLAALNELRHCALLSMAQPMAGLLQAALEQAASALAHYKHSRALGESEAPLFRAAVEAMSHVVVPYIGSCFARVFPGAGVGVDAAAVGAVLQEALTEVIP